MTNKDVVLMLFVIVAVSILFIYLMVTYTREINKYNKEIEKDMKDRAELKRMRKIESDNAQMQRIKRHREIEERIHQEKWSTKK